MSSSSDAAPPEQPAHVTFTPPTVEELGAMLPSYEVQFLIASGGMGAVYKAVQKDLDREVAIKILPPEAGDDAESMAQFRSEARAMAKLNHNNIVSIYDFGVVNGQCYFVMEYVEGQSVHEMIADGVVTPEMAGNLLSQVCDALSYAHSKGIIHGDIKPSNIVVNAEGTVKLLDFGLARLMEQDQSDTEVEWVPMGTPEYAAPELYERGAVADPRTDIYALGVVYYEMLMRTVPQGTFALPGTTMRLDGRVDDIIVRCLRPEPENRFQSASEVRSVLDDIRTGKPLVPVAPDAASRGPTHRRPPGVVAQQRPRAAVPTAAANMQRLAQHGAAAKKRKSSTGLVVGAVAVVGVALFAFKKMGGDTPPESQAAPPQETAKKAEPEPAKTSTPPSVDIGTAPVVTPAESVETERGKEAMSTPPATAAPSVPTPPPVTPPAVAEASSTPPPPVAPAGELSPALTRLKIEFTERYKTEIQARLQIAQREIGDKYLAALTKLEQGFMSKTDAAAVLQVRKEKDRFAKALAAPTASEMAPQDQLADYQKKLATALENLKKSVAAPVAKLNAEFAEAVDKLASSLEADGKKEQADAVKTFREKGKGVPDHLGILSGAVEQAAAAPDGVMEKGNLGLANRGAEALAENKPELIIDGESSQDSSGWSSVGGSIVVNLAKTYQLSNIYVRFPRRDRASWNFYLEVSPDGNQWAEVGDRRKGRVTGYQLFHLAPARPVKSIRLKITGIDGTERFLVEEVQAFCPVGNASADVKSPFDLKELICSSQWTWEKPDDSSEGLTFVPDGVVVQRYFDGTFEAMDSNTVTLTHKDRTTQLKFSADYQSYSGFDFDGKTPIKGTRKKPGQL